MKKDRVFTGIITGAKEVMNHKTQLNKINVFPVADGDTGSNLYSTMQSIITHSEEKSTLKLTLKSVAEAALVGARGNSGIIFAQYFQGFSEGIDEDEMNEKNLLDASFNGLNYAYDAVEVPVEGTILTIMRVFHDALRDYDFDSFEQSLENAYHHVLHAVEKTTEQLKVLKKASVVDSGARGFQMFLKGFIKGLKGELVLVEEESVPEIQAVHEDDFNYRYCTEALIKTKEEHLKDLIGYLGDSLIVAGNDHTKRVHIHTDEPSRVFDILSKTGTILEQKVDDMKLQYDMVHHRKYKRVIVTDSIADIPLDILDEEQVQMIHLSLLIGEESYFDKLTIENERVLSLAHLKPTSTLPSEKQIKNLYQYLQSYYDEIIVLCVSRDLSGTYGLMKRLAKDLDNVHVIDTMQNSVAQGLLVHQCIDYLKDGMATSEILRHISKDIENAKILVKVDSLDPMIRSGRLSVRMGSFVKRIGIKPIVTLRDGKGSIETVGLNRKKALKKLILHVEKIKHRHKIKKLALCYVDDSSEIHDLRRQLESLGIQVDYVVKSSAIIANGAGKGALALAYIKE
ncbi:DegV family EDD domain-containing protein [Acidaminobacter sp. JC074]|uniref:DegV family protein n=1 Tax=Acidaminobacter sp. JC074 TaxID=2530199 RepID=UPI001F111B33|nr:DegV family protein [Acidaminobacter sp. JC074]MCH4888453.1 DegV family EDD domain-containing protein [Acidaminobacter sp. JC074]